MKVKTIFTHQNIDELFFTKKTVVVIDVLRATSTIVTALNNGAEEIIPVNSIEFAMKVSSTGHTLLGGERNAQKIDGFVLGNSPLEYVEDIIKGKSIILFTTNGSKAIIKAKFASKLYLSSFLNNHAVAKKISKEDEVVILCSGNNGQFSFEDSVCAGDLIEELILAEVNVELDDSGKVCNLLFRKNKRRISKMLKETEHGKKLIELGFKKDIEYAAQKNIIGIVPYFESGSIKQA
ncbi:MAG: 2-phosphosulfolactate phosphatase [Ignavibacteriae bacterium]|nr:MAG: 2-phosphosulfolactate phosphatase [Ignavibacteriota bacterium]